MFMKQSKIATQGGPKIEILGLSDIRAISIIVVSYKSAFEQNCSLTYLLSFSFAYVVTLATSRRRLMFSQIKSCKRLHWKREFIGLTPPFCLILHPCTNTYSYT